MKSTETKSSSNTLQTKRETFFAKEGKHDFFSHTQQKPSFFNKKSANPSVQTKLTIGQPNDPYEKEADSVADKVVQRFAEPAAIQRKTATLSPAMPLVQLKCAACEHEDELHKKDEEEDKGVKKEKLQRKPIFESNGDPPDEENTIQRKCAACEKEEKLQKKDQSGNGINILRRCAACEKEEKLQKKADEEGSQTASASIENRLQSAKGSGAPLSPTTRNAMESSIGADFSGVRVHNDSSAVQMNKDLNAQAFTHGNDIYFNSGKYDTGSNGGQHLLAHELTHVVQQGEANRIRKSPDAATPIAAPNVDEFVKTIIAAMDKDDIPAVVAVLKEKSVDQLKAIRTGVNSNNHGFLEKWLAQRLNKMSALKTASKLLSVAIGVVAPAAGILQSQIPTGASSQDTAELGIRLLYPSLALIEKLELYDEGYRELEQAQIDIIKSASVQQRSDANKLTDRIEAVYKLMNPKEEFEARGLMDDSPEAKYKACEVALTRAPESFFSDTDLVYDAILDLTPANRKRFFTSNSFKLQKLLSDSEFKIIKTLTESSEAQALIIRLRLATEGRLDDQAGIQLVVDRARKLLLERNSLKIAATDPSLTAKDKQTIQSRLAELNDLDTLLNFNKGSDGKLDKNSFMGLLAAGRDNPQAFAADTKQLAEFAPDKRNYLINSTKQRIILAGSNLTEIEAALFALHAPRDNNSADAQKDLTPEQQNQEDQKIREEVLKDPEVIKVLDGLKGSERMQIQNDAKGDLFAEMLFRLNEAKNGANWAEFFHLILQVSRNPEWLKKFQDTSSDPFGVFAGVFSDERLLMLSILKEHKISLMEMLGYSTNVEFLKKIFEDVTEDDREQLRLGWELTKERPSGPLSTQQENAVKFYQDIEKTIRTKQTTLGVENKGGIETLLTAVLGSEPTAGEMSTDEGRYRAAAIMYERQEAKLHLDQGLSAAVTETDETMIAAAREFAALWLKLKDTKKISVVDFAALSVFNQRFLSRSGEFDESSNAISEMAGTIAATVAGIVVVVATGGAATPAVIALAAASGAGARVVTREMFGADYYNALSNQGARDALLGGIDGALAVVSGRLAAKGASLIGMGSHTLAGSAAKAAGVVAEEATQPFARRVAAGAVESALDGLFSGSVSSAFGTLTDDHAWREGIMAGLLKVGQAAILGGLTGLAAGGVLGAALPVVGKGAKSLWSAAVGQSIERSVEKAGMAPTLKLAREAAKRGEVEEVNKLMAELELKLSNEEAQALRQQLAEQLTEKLGHPPGRIALNDSQNQLLKESSTMETPTGKHLENEHEIVSKSDPQPSSEPGYIDEVNLGNEHVWRRREDGTWCRFTKKVLCGTNLPNAKPLSRAAIDQSNIRFAEANLAEAQGSIIAHKETIEEYNKLVDSLVDKANRGEKYNFKSLTEKEQEAIGQVFPNEEHPENLTLAQLQQPRAKPVLPGGKQGLSELEIELAKLYSAEERSIANLRDANIPLGDKLHSASPTGRLRDQIISRSGNLDYVSKLPPASQALDVDHVVPLRQIMDMKGFNDLDWLDKVAIANYEGNLKAVDRSINRARGDRSWADLTWPRRNEYSPEALQKITQDENRLRVELQNEINKRLKSGIPNDYNQ